MSRTVHVQIPDWVPTKDDFKYTYRKIKFFFNPFRCSVCKTKIDFKHPNYKGKCLLSTGVGKDPAYCRNCLADKISEFFKLDHPTDIPDGYDDRSVKTTKCDCCSETKVCSTIIRTKPLDMRFGVNWWNGHWICEDCLVECAKTGRIETGISIGIRGKSYRMNEAGVLFYAGKSLLGPFFKQIK